MPFLEYHRLEQSNIGTVRALRGYAESTDIWEILHQIRDAADRLGISKRTITKAILASGPCPDLWRVYYSATFDAQSDEAFSRDEYLGIRLPTGMTRRRLGESFDKWIRTANHAYNQFIETRQLDKLQSIPGRIGELYRHRAKQHLQEADETKLQRARMNVSPNVRIFPELPIPELIPDGIFLGGSRGAVFESKLSFPGYVEFTHEMAVYALFFERAEGKDIDFSIVVYTDYPDGRNLFQVPAPILDSAVGAVTKNLERFLNLLAYSEAAHAESPRESVVARIKRKIGRRYSSWKEFLVRPGGLPEHSKRQPCSICKFQPRCYREGG